MSAFDSAGVYLLQDIPVPALRVQDGLIMEFNTSFKKSVMDVPYLEGRKLLDIVRDCDREGVERLLNGKEASNTLNCDVLQLSDSNEFPAYLPVTLHSNGSGLVIVIVQQERPREETTPLETMIDPQKETMIDFLENAPIGLQWLSGTGHVLWANKTQLEVLGYRSEEFVGKHITEFSTDSEEVLQKNFARLYQGETLHMTSDWLTKTGEKRRVCIDSNLRFDDKGNMVNSRCFIRDDTAAQIQRALTEAEKTLKLKILGAQDRFLRKVLHEIRTPANTIIQSLNTADAHDTEILKQMQKLVRIVKDTEDADTFERGKVLVQKPIRFPLASLLQSLFISTCEDYENPLVTPSLTYSSPTIPVDISCDRQCLSRVLSHLLDNGLRFTSEGFVRLDISFNEAESSIHFSVQNSGPPVKQDWMHRVCQKYWDLDTCTNADQTGQFTDAGIGLGLNIVFNILQSMGSMLEVKSAHGVNTFSFTLKNIQTWGLCECSDPRLSSWSEGRTSRSYSWAEQSSWKEESDAWETGRAWVAVEESKQSKIHVTNATDPLKVIPQPTPTHVQCEVNKQVPKRPFVLITDDNTVCQKVLCRTLQKINCNTAIAANGLIARDTALTNHYDAIIMDLRMPVCDGIQATKLIRTALDSKAPPIIGFSADSSPEILEQCMSAGMCDFIQKPASQETIRNTLGKYVTFIPS